MLSLCLSISLLSHSFVVLNDTTVLGLVVLREDERIQALPPLSPPDGVVGRCACVHVFLDGED